MTAPRGRDKAGVSAAAKNPGPAPLPRWSVLVQKSSGVQIVFSTYINRSQADRVARRLRAVGCPCTIERSHGGDISGQERRT